MPHFPSKGDLEVRPAPAGIKVSPLWKTRLCSYHALGGCNRGASCVFAHGDGELRATPNFAKTSICPDLLKNGICSRAECCYAHSREELNQTPGLLKTRLCSFSVRGACVLGDRCRFAHNIQELQTAAEVLHGGSLNVNSVARLMTGGNEQLSAGLGSAQASKKKWEQHRQVFSRGQASQVSDVSVGQEVQPSEPVRVVKKSRTPTPEFLHRRADAATHAEVPKPSKLPRQPSRTPSPETYYRIVEQASQPAPRSAVASPRRSGHGKALTRQQQAPRTPSPETPRIVGGRAQQQPRRVADDSTRRGDRLPAATPPQRRSRTPSPEASRIAAGRETPQPRRATWSSPCGGLAQQRVDIEVPLRTPSPAIRMAGGWAAQARKSGKPAPVPRFPNDSACGWVPGLSTDDELDIQKPRRRPVQTWRSADEAEARLQPLNDKADPKGVVYHLTTRFGFLSVEPETEVRTQRSRSV